MLKNFVKKHTIMAVLLVAGLIIFHIVMWTWLNYECTITRTTEPSPCADLSRGPLRRSPVSTVLNPQLQAVGSGWETYSIDFYCGPINPGLVSGNSVLKELPGDAKMIVGWEGAVSTFTGLHVDTWLSLDAPEPKEGHNVFGIIKTGDEPSTSSSLLNISLSVMSHNLYINFWFHNMRMITSDWHVGYVIYYVTNATLSSSSASVPSHPPALGLGNPLQEPKNILETTALAQPCRGADVAEQVRTAWSTNGECDGHTSHQCA